MLPLACQVLHHHVDRVSCCKIPRVSGLDGGNPRAGLRTTRCLEFHRCCPWPGGIIALRLFGALASFPRCRIISKPLITAAAHAINREPTPRDTASRSIRAQRPCQHCTNNSALQGMSGHRGPVITWIHPAALRCKASSYPNRHHSRIPCTY